MWRGIFVHGVPLIIAIGAALLLLPWIMGASAIQGEAGSQGYTVGTAALFLYPASYQVLIVVWAICRWQRWSLQRAFLQLIWLSLLLFFGAMTYSWIQLRDDLQGSASQALLIVITPRAREASRCARALEATTGPVNFYRISPDLLPWPIRSARKFSAGVHSDWLETQPKCPFTPVQPTELTLGDHYAPRTVAARRHHDHCHGEYCLGAKRRG